jgi:hypothetical protein
MQFYQPAKTEMQTDLVRNPGFQKQYNVHAFSYIMHL